MSGKIGFRELCQRALENFRTWVSSHFPVCYEPKQECSDCLPFLQYFCLERFVLDENQFSGPLHENIRHLTSLKELMLQLNSFSGVIPDDVFENMSNLELLMLRENFFEGSIPKSLGSCTKLREVYLEYNGFLGEVPAELGSLQSLELLSVESNNFTGTMPDEICGLIDGGVLGYLVADCKENEIVCECCHKCF
jgi:hypothetical protein